MLSYSIDFRKGEFGEFMFALFLASKSMQEGWGSGGDDMNLGTSQWEDEEGGVWNNAASQESASSCSSWGSAPKKGLPKVCATLKKRNSKNQWCLKTRSG